MHFRVKVTLLFFLILLTVFDTQARPYDPAPSRHMPKVPIMLSHRWLSGRYRVSLKYLDKLVQRL